MLVYISDIECLPLPLEVVSEMKLISARSTELSIGLSPFKSYKPINIGACENVTISKRYNIFYGPKRTVDASCSKCLEIVNKKY